MAGARRKAGRMPFMPAVRLNQLCCAATEAGYPSRFLARGFSPVRFLLFLFLFCSSSFGPFNVLLSERERSLWWLGLRFYALEQAPNMVIYAMSKSGTAASG